MKKGIELDGPAFLNIFSPCVPGWRIDPDQAVECARQGVETRYWPLYEVENGHYRINYKPKKRVPVADWLFSQGRFRHLRKPEHAPIVEALQAQVDHYWDWLLEQEGQASSP
jgi:pyruvate ferredoxin oxidoreductase beta subunit